FYPYDHTRHLHSFPTRRSSDLTAVCGSEQEGTRNPGGHTMAKTRPRKRYTEDQRTTILSVAQREGLTATEVKKRFGVTPVTYYSDRKSTRLNSSHDQISYAVFC